MYYFINGKCTIPLKCLLYIYTYYYKYIFFEEKIRALTQYD